MADIQKLNVNGNTYDISTTWEKVTGKPSTFPPASHTHSYLPLSGGTMTGIIKRSSGGGWISGRDNVIIMQTKTNPDGNSWNPVIGVKTQAGCWTMGSVGGEGLQLSYDTDTNYDSRNNTSSVIYFPSAGSTGTLALTSQIPTNTNQLTNGAGFITGITKSMVTTALGYTPPTSDTNTWRPVTNTYTGSDQSTCVSQYGTNALYNALLNGYASSAGSASSVPWSGVTSKPILPVYYNLSGNDAYSILKNNATSFARNQLVHAYLGHGSASFAMGWVLSGYDSTPYCAFIVNGYGDNWYLVGSSSGNWTNRTLLHSGNIGSYALTSLPSHTHTKSQITDFPSSLPANGGTATYASYLGTSSSYYTKSSLDTALAGKAAASHTHSYLPLSGGTLTGKLTISSSDWNNQLHLNRTSSSGSWGPAISFDYDGTCNGTLSMTSNKLYVGDNGGARAEVSMVGHTHDDRYYTESEINTKLSGKSDTGHTHTYIRDKNNYSFTSSNLPTSFDQGISCGFVEGDSVFPSYGSVLTVRTYSAGGGSLQLYAPYSNTYGGSRLRARFGDYNKSNGNSWTDLKEIAWLSDIPTSLPASDVYSWAKASSKPTYTYSEVGAAAASHTHSYLPLSGGTLTGLLNITANGVTATYGAQNSSWVHFYNSAGVSYYFSNSIEVSGAIKVYNTSWGITSGGRFDGSGFYQSSDERLKTFYEPIKPDLEKLKTLRKNYFKFNDKDKLEIGVSAQEVQSIYPEIVSTDDNGYLSVAYDKLSVIALAAIDELDDKILQLANKISTLENILNKLMGEKGIN